MIISKEEFTELANHKAANCVTVYMPAHSAGVEVNEKHDVITFKNHLQKARQQLEQKGLDHAVIEKVLRKGFELLDNEGFWKNQSEGLAVFLSENTFKIAKLPVKVKEELFVNSSFYLSPLLPLMRKRKHFYFLLLSKHDSKLFEGDAWGMKEIKVEGLPNGMDDVVHYEEKGGKQLMRRAGATTGGPGSVQGANFHGHGAGVADDDEYLTLYLREVDQTLRKEVLGTQNVPMVVAAVDYVLSAFKQVSRYGRLWNDHLTGNFEYEDKNSLFEKVRAKVEPYFKEDTKKALLNYYNNSAGELTSSVPEDVIPAAYYGRISDLYVCRDEHIWGTFNEADNKIVIHDSKQENDECLINNAIIKTIMNGGDVHLLEKGKMPADSKVAAFFRF